MSSIVERVLHAIETKSQARARRKAKKAAEKREHELRLHRASQRRYRKRQQAIRRHKHAIALRKNVRLLKSDAVELHRLKKHRISCRAWRLRLKIKTKADAKLVRDVQRTERRALRLAVIQQKAEAKELRNRWKLTAMDGVRQAYLDLTEHRPQQTDEELSTFNSAYRRAYNRFYAQDAPALRAQQQIDQGDNYVCA
jgi:hypothetical protein